MSTNDVPGFDEANSDELGMGCWAEHADGSLIFVESTEGRRVIFCVFDISKTPPVQYRDAMQETAFKTEFSYEGGRKKGKSKDRWTWHDKTPFPWDRIIKAGVEEGSGHVVVHDQLNAAERVREHLKLRGRQLTASDLDSIKATKMEKTVKRTLKLFDKLKDALKDLDV